MNNVEITGTIGHVWRSRYALMFRLFYADNQNSLCIELRDDPAAHTTRRPIQHLRQMLYPVITIDGHTKTDKEAIAKLQKQKISLKGTLKSQNISPLDDRENLKRTLGDHNYIEVSELKIGDE